MFTCIRCQRSVHHPVDAVRGWCRSCESFTALFYDRSGRALSIDEFEQLYTGPGREERIRVANDKIGPVQVSTVWLGINNNFIDNGPPIIFETMTFVPQSMAGSAWDSNIVARYRTEAEALAGHQRICHEVAASLASEN